MKIRLTLHQLEAVLRVAEFQSFRQAAETLHVSQPALSRTIAMAEDSLGTRLFDRNTRHVNLTPAGEQIMPIARRILGEFNDSLSDLGQFLGGHAGRITVSSLPSASVALLPPTIAEFRATRPNVDFVILSASTTPLLELLLSGQADLAVTAKPPPDERLNYEHLMDDEIVLLCHKNDSLAKSKKLGWKAFEERPFIGTTLRGSIQPILDAAMARHGVIVKTVLQASNASICGAAVASGIGITAMSRLTLPTMDCRNIAVRRLDPPYSRPIGVVTLAGRSPSPSANAFKELLIAKWRKKLTAALRP